MGDLMIRISLLVQRGVLCQSCGGEVGGEMSGSPRSCEACRIQNFENEGGMIYSEEKKPMEPYVPEWACRRWGGYEHDWLDCVDCQVNYEGYLEENINRFEAAANNPPPAHNSRENNETS